MDELEIKAAVLEYLSRHRHAAAWQPSVAEFVTHLIDWRGWPDSAAEEVGRRLRARVDPESSAAIHRS